MIHFPYPIFLLDPYPLFLSAYIPGDQKKSALGGLYCVRSIHWTMYIEIISELVAHIQV